MFTAPKLLRDVTSYQELLYWTFNI